MPNQNQQRHNQQQQQHQQQNQQQQQQQQQEEDEEEKPPQQQFQGAPERNSDPDLFRFAVTTDNHLGFMERDSRRGEDSFIAFEECLQQARLYNDCDALLLGGDLFHENKPSLGTMQKTITLFRRYCMGDREVQFELRSNPATNFPTHPQAIANFQDPNLNVALPVFIIHGNHDDPSGGIGVGGGAGGGEEGAAAAGGGNQPVSAIDILSSAGLVNYFGHTPNIEDIYVRPVLLRKGNTHVALYGMGNIRDDRLHRAFRIGKVHFVKPSGDLEKWFNILIIHQNRGIKGGMSKCGISEAMFKGCGVDLVIWGNEHDQQIEPFSHADANLDVIQPGSTVFTSLSMEETQPKKCAIIEVKGTQYRVTNKHTLTHVRPVVRRAVKMSEQRVAKSQDAVEDHLRQVARGMIDEADELVNRIPADVLAKYPNLRYPLMRMAVDFADSAANIAASAHNGTGGQGTPWPQPNLNRLGQSYTEVMVNPGDFVKSFKSPSTRTALQAANRAIVFNNNNNNNNQNQNQNQNNDFFVGPEGGGGGGEDDAAGGGVFGNVFAGGRLPVDDIRSKISSFLSSNTANAKDKCRLFSENEISQAVYAYVEKGEKYAIDDKLKELLKGTQRSIWKQVKEKENCDEVTEEELRNLALRHKEELNKNFTAKNDFGVAGGDGENSATSATAAAGGGGGSKHGKENQNQNQNNNTKNSKSQKKKSSRKSSNRNPDDDDEDEDENDEDADNHHHNHNHNLPGVAASQSGGDILNEIHKRITQKNAAPVATGNVAKRRGRQAGGEEEDDDDDDDDLPSFGRAHYDNIDSGDENSNQQQQQQAKPPAAVPAGGKGKRASAAAAGGKKVKAKSKAAAGGGGGQLDLVPASKTDQQMANFMGDFAD